MSTNNSVNEPTAAVGKILQGAGVGTTSTWSTSTYPATNAVSTLLYASSANVMGALATANNGVLITSATGVPSILAAGTTGQVLIATTSSPPSWGTATGTLTTTKITLTNAQCKALASTAIQVVAAQGSGTIIVPVMVCYRLNYGGTNAFTGGQDVCLQYASGLGTNKITDNGGAGSPTSGAFTTTANRTYIGPCNSSGGTTGAGNSWPSANVENVAIYVANLGTAIAGNAANDNTIDVSVTWYSITP